MSRRAALSKTTSRQYNQSPATPVVAAIDDMSHAEFFQRSRTGNWTQPLSHESFHRDVSPRRVVISPRRKVVADMVAAETARRLGAQWVPTALKLAKIESSFNCGAVGPRTRHGHARGVLQVMPGSARALGYDPRRLNECQYGIAAGVAHMASCIQSGVRTHAQMASCHVAGTYGWKARLNPRAESYRRSYIRLAMR
jgi:hypothetical protein